MVLVTFNVPQEIKGRLQLEKNQSKLITDLVTEHYQDLSDINEKLKQIQDKKEQYLKTLDIQEEKLKNKYQIELKKKEVEEEIESKIKDKREKHITNCITNCKELFNIELTREQVEEYFDSGYEILRDYLVNEGLIKKE